MKVDIQKLVPPGWQWVRRGRPELSDKYLSVLSWEWTQMWDSGLYIYASWIVIRKIQRKAAKKK